jgi:hypothetical protein
MMILVSSAKWMGQRSSLMPKEDHLYKLRKAVGPKWNPEEHHARPYPNLNRYLDCNFVLWNLVNI